MLPVGKLSSKLNGLLFGNGGLLLNWHVGLIVLTISISNSGGDNVYNNSGLSIGVE